MSDEKLSEALAEVEGAEKDEKAAEVKEVAKEAGKKLAEKANEKTGDSLLGVPTKAGLPKPSAIKIADGMSEEPYEWDKTTVVLTLIIQPKEEGSNERSVIVSGRTHGDAPVIRVGSEKDFPLPPIAQEIVSELEDTLDERKLASMKEVVDSKKRKTSSSKSSTKSDKKQLSLL